MDISGDVFWRVHLAALWIPTRSPHACGAVLYHTGIGPWCNASTWLEEHKSEILPEFQNWGARSPLDLAFDELSRAVWDERLTLYNEDGKPRTDVLKNFTRVSETRAWIESERPYVQAQEVLALWPAKLDSTRPHVDNPLAPSPTTARFRKSYKQDAVIDALRAIYPTGYYSGIAPSDVYSKVIPWLEENRPGVKVSEDTVRRTLTKFAALPKNT
jgi:hypothetical protein